MYLNLRPLFLKGVGFTFFGVAFVSLFVPLLLLALWMKRRKQRASKIALPESDDELIGNAEDLRLAEQSLMVSDTEIRERLLQEHVLYAKYSSLHGYDDARMDRFVQDLRNGNIQCELFFQETAPVGLASITGRQGFYELYINREQVKEAELFLQKQR